LAQGPEEKLGLVGLRFGCMISSNERYMNIVDIENTSD
jgi:hypothetical protein